MFDANISFTERGNVALSQPDGTGWGSNEAFWVIDGDYAVLEITFTPNYPAWQVASCKISLEELAKHINTNLQGWYVRKANIDGLNMDEEQIVHTCDDDEVAAESCHYCQGNCPNEPDDSEDLCDGFAGDIDGLYAEQLRRDEKNGLYPDRVDDSN